MGRSKHCTPEKRRIIRQLLSEGKTYTEIQNSLQISAKMISNAKNYKEKPETRGRKKVLSPKSVRRIVRCSKALPHLPATEIKKELNLNASVETFRRILRRNNLNARSPRKVPLLTKKHIAKRIQFAKTHVHRPLQDWRNILWTDESKIVLYGSPGSREYVRRPPNAEYVPRYTRKTVKHGGSSIMVWGSFSYHGVGPIYRINGVMDQHVYVDILQGTMLPYAEEEMPIRWVFQQDNDPKHTSKKAKEWFRVNNISVLDWPPQSPDLNPIENLWADVKKMVAASKPTNNNQLWITVETAWKSIPLERCQALVDSMKRRCEAVISNKGSTTKY